MRCYYWMAAVKLRLRALSFGLLATIVALCALTFGLCAVIAPMLAVAGGVFAVTSAPVGGLDCLVLSCIVNVQLRVLTARAGGM